MCLQAWLNTVLPAPVDLQSSYQLNHATPHQIVGVSYLLYLRTTPITTANPNFDGLVEAVTEG